MVRRLKQLHYKVVPLSETILVAEDAGSFVVMVSGFRCTVTRHTLTAEPSEYDYDDPAEAHSVLQPALDAWSATSELIDICPVAFELQGHHFEVVVPEGDQVLYVHGLDDTATVTEAITVIKDRLPQPHVDIRVEGPVSAQTRRRWRNVAHGKESVTAVGYFILTSVEVAFGGKAGAAKTLNIATNVLEDLGRLCSVADPEHGRKADGRPGKLTGEQLGWIRYVCPRIIERVLRHEAGADISHTLTKDHLPSLSTKA